MSDNLPSVQSEAATLMAVISRAASDPATDVDKLERLLGMYERIEAKRAERAYADAMNAAQSEMRAISQDASNPQTRSKYASYGALDAACRPIYSRHGFALSFDTGEGAPQDWIRVVCNVTHRDGHATHPHLDMPADGKGAKGGDVMTKTHATMSAVSYGRRGLLKMVWNLSEGEYDDDGNGASGHAVGNITPEQVSALETLATEVGADMVRFLKYMNVGALAEISSTNFNRAKIALEAKKKTTHN